MDVAEAVSFAISLRPGSTPADLDSVSAVTK
jgi:hypothetical protein